MRKPCAIAIVVSQATWSFVVATDAGVAAAAPAFEAVLAATRLELAGIELRAPDHEWDFRGAEGPLTDALSTTTGGRSPGTAEKASGGGAEGDCSDDGAHRCAPRRIWDTYSSLRATPSPEVISVCGDDGGWVLGPRGSVALGAWPFLSGGEGPVAATFEALVRLTPAPHACGPAGADLDGSVLNGSTVGSAASSRGAFGASVDADTSEVSSAAELPAMLLEVAARGRRLTVSLDRAEPESSDNRSCGSDNEGECGRESGGAVAGECGGGGWLHVVVATAGQLENHAVALFMNGDAAPSSEQANGSTTTSTAATSSDRRVRVTAEMRTDASSSTLARLGLSATGPATGPAVELGVPSPGSELSLEVAYLRVWDGLALSAGQASALARHAALPLAPITELYVSSPSSSASSLSSGDVHDSGAADDAFLAANDFATEGVYPPPKKLQVQSQRRRQPKRQTKKREPSKGQPHAHDGVGNTSRGGSTQKDKDRILNEEKVQAEDKDEGDGECVVGVCVTGALRAMASASVQTSFLRAMGQLGRPWPPPRHHRRRHRRALNDAGGDSVDDLHSNSRHGRRARVGWRDGGWRARGCRVEILAHVSLGAAAENKGAAVEASRLQIDR